MTLTEMLDYLRRRQNEDGAQSPHWSDAELLQLVETRSNEMLINIGLIRSKDTSVTSTSGTNSFSFPTDFVKLQRIWYAGVPLKYIPFRQFESRTPSGTAPSGTPREFTVWADTVYMVPTPSTSSVQITIFGEKKQGSLTTTSSTFSMPALSHIVICHGVLADMYAKDLNPNMMSAYENKYTQGVAQLQKYSLSRQRKGMPITVTDADSSLETEFGII